MALARQLAKHCRHGYWSQRSLLCAKVTATPAQTGVEKGLRGSDRHRPRGEDAHRELGQMSGGRRVLASRPFYFAIVFSSSYRVTRKLCPGAEKPSCRTLARYGEQDRDPERLNPRPERRRGCRAPHLRAASSWQHHYRYQVITPPTKPITGEPAGCPPPTRFPSGRPFTLTGD